MESGTIIQINISPGGLPKYPVETAEVQQLGIVGDDHRNKKYHGGPQKAILLIASEVIDALREEGWPLFYGALGENFTTRGVDSRLWTAGQRFQCGSAVLELTTPRQPCLNLDVYGKGIQQRIFDKRVKNLDLSSPVWGMSGFYASVIRPGKVQKMDIIKRVEIGS
jgi:MOSC domain-containing protein YiiM